MKNLIATLCMLVISLGLQAQDESTPNNWITGEQESSFPGETIKYAICQSTQEFEGQATPVTVSINAMIFKGVSNFFLSVKGDEFIIENIESINVQKVLIQFDDNKAVNYPLVGDNTYSASKLQFESSYRSKFKKGLKTAKTCKISFEFKNAGHQTFEFNVEGLDPAFLK